VIKISRHGQVSAFVLIFLSSACAARIGTSPIATVLPATSKGALATPAGVPLIPLIPITGENVVNMQCQFCVGEETHAVLIFPDFAYFDVNHSSLVTCLTADVVNGKRILLCRGPQSTFFNLNICSSSSNCLQFPVALQPCELLQGGPAAPVFLTPVRPKSNEDREPAQPPPATQQAVPAPPTSAPPPTEGNGNGEERGEVVICHIPPGHPDKRKTMTVTQSAWENEHSRHGDSLGACP
jgi:hypothetical protein